MLFPLAHDVAGNVHILPDRTDPDAAKRFTYDYRNRLIKVESTTNYNAETPTWTLSKVYHYDGWNRRINETPLDSDPTDGIMYLYDGWQCIEEREWDLNGANPDVWEARRQYVYGGQYIDEPLIFDKDEDDDGDCTDDPGTGSDRYYYLHDSNFNVVALADTSGDVQERCWYEPYGSVTFTDSDGNNPSTTSSEDNTLTFQGRRLDDETGLYYFRSRNYSPVLGRFLQRDPAGYQDGMNLYEYAGGNPVAMSDPTGEGAFDWVKQKANWVQETASSAWSATKDIGYGVGLAAKQVVLDNFGSVDRTVATLVGDIGFAPETSAIKTATALTGSGQDVGISLSLFYRAAAGVVTCCDENNCLWQAAYLSFGLASSIGADASWHTLGDTLKGENCPEGFEALFAEVEATINVAKTPIPGVDVSAGVTVEIAPPDSSGRQVQGIGAQVGLSGPGLLTTPKGGLTVGGFHYWIYPKPVGKCSQ